MDDKNVVLWKHAIARLVQTMIESLVDEPRLVTLQGKTTGPKDLLLEITVGPKDIGKVIGKQGRTMRSIRTVVYSASKRFGATVELQLMQAEEVRDEQAA